MLRIKKSKLLLVLAVVISLLFPYATPVLAATQTATYKQSDLTGQTITMQNSFFFPDGHSYVVDNPAGNNDRMLYKIYVKNDSGIDKTNAIYCLDEQKIFPGFDKNGNSTTSDYKNMGDFYDSTNTEVAKYIAQENIGTANYNAIVELTKIMYLLYQDDDNKTGYNTFLNNVFGNYLTEVNKEFDDDQKETIDNIKNNTGITLDDINAIEQCAIWYFSNKDVISVTEDSSVSIYDATGVTSLDDVKLEYKLPSFIITKLSIENPNGIPETVATNRKAALDMIYSYLVHTAKAGNNSQTVSSNLPEFVDTDAVAEVDGTNYKVGPFTITSASSTGYKITLTDGTNDITNYELKTADGETIENLQNVVGKTFYVYVPVSSKVTNVKVGIEYLESTTYASFWEKVDGSGNVDYTYQPLVWITKDPKEPQYKEVPIEESDLALRKYLVSQNGDNSVARTPVVDATALLNGETTASYKHKKSPIEVSEGDKLVYEIRVYNEGNTSATVKEIYDYIPEGLELVPKSESTVNSTYIWEEVEAGVVKTVVNKELAKIDSENINSNKNTISGGLDNTFVQIELKVKSGLKSGNVITNIAEIADDNISDRDSDPKSIDENTRKNSSTYTGNKDNKTDLDDSNYHYKGSQDDDDFEKIKVKGKTFDLKLMKFVTDVNGSKISGREPSVDVTPLKNGSTTAKYTSNKNPLVVKKGDIVTYTIRVYNEGDIDGYAEEVADYIPEGLGFIVNYKTNVDNYWSITEAVKAGAKTVKLSTIENATGNVKLSDFENVTSLEDVEVVQGKAKILSTALSSNVSKDNIIEKFDESKDTLNYKDLKVTCVVLADKVTSNNFRNIAEITDDSKDDGDDNNDDKTVEDRDSTPDSVNPDDYPGGDKDQDDHDYEDLTVEEKSYDLALQKFITSVEGNSVTDRVPVVTFEDGKIRYNHSSTPISTGNEALIEYTIRVYNEGKSAAYAAEVADDLPKGLTYVVDNATNIEYGWQLVDKNGNVTTDLNQAVTARTTYLSKEASEKRGEDNLLKPFDSSKAISTDSNNPNPDYRDLKIVFKVTEADVEATTTTEKRIIQNTAEITKETDEDGNDVTDEDSTPDNWKDGEDDIDKERIYVKYFDLSLKKDLVKVIVIENGNAVEYNVSEDQLFKVEINKKKLNSTVIKFVYNITVTNEGEIEGYAKEVKDYIPEGLEFVSDDNTGWYKLSDGVVATDALANTLLEPGKSASVSLTLKWINGENNLGKKVNIAEISKHENKYNSPDIDSTPDNRAEQEDDIDDAPVLLSISTGADENYFGLIAVVAVIMTTGVVLIKKYVL